MRKLACMILIVAIIVGGLLLLESAHAATPVNGTIGTTTWTTANSPYTLTGNAIVSYGATLTIQPGVTVNFGSYQLQVNGVLTAQGTSNSKIYFQSSSYSDQKIDFTYTSSGLIDNAVISSVPIAIEGGSPTISNTYFYSTPNSPITISGGAPSITNNVVNLQSYAEIHINYGSPVISYNTIKGQGQNYGIYTEGTASITNNNITGCYSGIYAVGASTIQQNNILNNAHDGIRSDNSASIIQNNAIANNLCGIGGNGIIRNNTITNNNYGIWGPTELATMANNNIFANTENIHLTENASNVDATYNWWGTTDESAINQTIWDFKDASNLGNVTFIPFLDQLNPFAPSIPTYIPIPTAPPTPSPTPFTTPTSSLTPTSTPYTSPTPTPTQTPSEPVKSPDLMFGQFSVTDVENMVVIVLAIALAITIIVVINKKFGKK